MAKRIACKPRAARRRSVSRFLTGKQRRKQPFELALEVREARPRRFGFEVNHTVDSGQRGAAGVAAKELTSPAFEAMPHHRWTDLAARGQAKPGSFRVVGEDVEKDQGATATSAGGVTAAVMLREAKRLAPLQALGARRGRGHGTVRPSDACGPCGGGAREPCGRSWCSCARESHGSSCACDCSAETCASRWTAFPSFKSTGTPHPARGMRSE